MTDPLVTLDLSKSYLQDLVAKDSLPSGTAVWSTVRGSRLEQYQLGKTLGHGEFGQVKKCVDTDTGEHYAVKVVQKGFLEKLNMEDQFCREVSALVQFGSHDHIVRLVDFLQTDEHFFVVMELIQGGTLIDRLTLDDRTAMLNESVCRRYFQQIVSAVAFMHSHGICHRDIKLENIMIDESDNIRMLDFGFCAAQSEGVLLNTVCGSVDYCAPEVVQARRKTAQGYDGFAADVWSLGCLLFVLLTGRLPFRGANYEETVHRLSTCQIHIPPHVTTHGRHLLINLLKVNPKERLSMQAIMEHPWVTQNWENNVKQNMSTATQQLGQQYLSIRRVKERNHRMNAFEVVANLTNDSINTLVLQSFIGMTTQHFLCRGEPQAVGQELVQAMNAAQGNPQPTRADSTEVSAYVRVTTGVVILRATVEMTLHGDLVLVSIHRLRGNERDFVDYCNLLRMQLSHSTACVQTPATLNALELVSVLNDVNMGGLSQQHDLMCSVQSRTAFLLVCGGKLCATASWDLSCCTSRVLQILRDKIHVTAFHGDGAIWGHDGLQPLLTFCVRPFGIQNREGYAEGNGKVLLRVTMGQGLYPNFKTFTAKLFAALSSFV